MVAPIIEDIDMYVIILMFESREKSWEEFKTKEEAVAFYRHAVTDADVIQIELIEGEMISYLS